MTGRRGAVGKQAVTDPGPDMRADPVRRRHEPFDNERYRAHMLDDWYRRNCLVIESLDEQALIGADYDNDHLSACLWSLQQAAQRLDVALRGRR